MKMVFIGPRSDWESYRALCGPCGKDAKCHFQERSLLSDISPIAHMRDMAMFRDHKLERGEVEG